MSWSGRGIEDESRERMIAAGRRSGMSVSELVQSFADGARGRDPRETVRRRRWDAEPIAHDADRIEDLDRQLDHLSNRLRSLTGDAEASGRRPRGGRGRDVDSRDAMLDEIASTVDRLNRRAEEGRGERRSDDDGRIGRRSDEDGRAGRRSDEDGRAGRRGGSAAAGDDSGIAKILSALDGLDQRIRSLAEDRSRESESEAAPKGRRGRAAVGDLDRAISEIADRQNDLDRRGGRAAARTNPDLERHFRELSEKLDSLRGRDGESQTQQLMAEIRGLRDLIERRATGGADVTEEVRRLAGKIDELAAHHPRLDTIEPLMTEISRLRDTVLQSNVEGSLKTLEAGYGHIVDRLDDLKRGLAGPRVGAKVDAEISEIHNLLRAVPQVTQFSAIERSFADLAEKVDRLAARDEGDRSNQIERRIAEMKSQIEQIDPAPVVRALDQRLKALTDKLDGIERATRGPVAPDHVAALVDELRTVAATSRTGEELKALELRLADLGDRISDFDRRRPSFDDTDRLHERLNELSTKIEGLTAPGTDRRTTDTLEAMIGRLDEILTRPAAPAPAPVIEPRLAALIDRLEQSDRSDRTADVSALTREIAEMRKDLNRSQPSSDLEAQMRLLAERLDRSSSQEPDDETLAQIEDQLSRISRHLEATDARFQTVSALQSGIERLGQRLESTHVDAVAAAREAAREMMRELGTATAGAGDGQASEVLRALRDDLKSLQSAASDTENRTNDTLISLHDALTGIVGRLSAIEKIAQGSARNAAAKAAGAVAATPAGFDAPASAQPAPFVPAASAQPAPFVPAPSAQPAPFAPAPSAQPAASVQPAAAPAADGATIAGRPVSAASAVARARELLTASAEDSRPLEPGSGKPSVRPQAAAAPAVEAPTGRPAGEPVTAASRKADFIAAARRAAQAAAGAAPFIAQADDRAAAAQAASTVEAGETPAPESNGGGPLARLGKVLKSRRRPLVLATAALVLAILTLQLIPGGSEQQADAGRQPAKVETAQPAMPPKSAGRLMPPGAETQIPTGMATTAGASSAMPQATGEAGVSSIPQQASGMAPGPSMAPTAAVPQAQTGMAPQAQTGMQSVPAGAPASVPAPAASLGATAPQKTSSLVAPTPDASLMAPTTTGSIPNGEAQTTVAPAGSSLPSAIGSETLRKAAEAGDPRAAFEVGMRFAEGRGVTADSAKAVEWYRRAADKGLIPATYRLAVALEKGLGTERDPEGAKRAYQTAAEAGNIRAMHNLGVLHANARDMNAAIPWFQKAADQGLKDSQFNLGIIYALGSGVKQDLAVSYKWFALAARQGDKEAEKKQNDVATHLDKVNLAAAKMAVQTFVQRPMERAANDEAQVWAEATNPQQQMRDTIARTQNLLKANGLYGGAINGEMTAQTRAAIKAFQKKSGLAQNGEIDANLIKALVGKPM